MNKYIIKNCPCFTINGEAFNSCKCKDSSSINGIHQEFCKDILDCLLKRIVELCKENYTSDDNVFDISKKIFALRILDLLEIEEVE